MYKFKSQEDRTEVQQARPYPYHNKPFILKSWTVDYVFDKEIITTVSLWANFLGLPEGYWSIEALRKVASAIGNPLCTDKYITYMNRISYALCWRSLTSLDL